MSYTACAAPYARVMIYGIIPMPLWGVVVGFFLYDLYGASRRSVCQTIVALILHTNGSHSPDRTLALQDTSGARWEGLPCIS